MLKKLKNAFTLVHFPVRIKLILAVLGGACASAIDLLGVLISYPLLLIVTGADLSEGIPGRISHILNIDERGTLIVVLASVVAACFMFKSFITLSFRWWLLGFTNKIENEARVNLLHGYLDSPYIDHRKRKIPELHTNLVTAITQTFGQVVLGSISFFTGGITILFMLSAMFVISPLAASVAIIIFGGAGAIIPFILRKKMLAIGADIREADWISWFSSMPALQAFHEMRLFNTSALFLDEYKRGARIRSQANRRASFYSELPKNFIEIIFVLGIAVLSTILFMTQSSESAVSTLGVFIVATTRMMPNINSTIASFNVVRAGTVGLDVVCKEISSLNKPWKYSEIKTQNTDFSGDIRIKSVSFTYDDEKYVLKDVSLDIPEGHTVAFVGSSGSGKSTLIDIILGMLEPTRGDIIVNGQSIYSDVKAWHSNLGVVPQSVYILPGSLKKNIGFGLPEEEIDRELAQKCAYEAELGELLESLPDGIDEDLGQDGNRLSGGQKQRLGIARALYRRPKVLILDEATSALDNKTEHKITQTIDGLSGKATVILVAHRLSTVRKADTIFYMSQGEIVGSGSFDELYNSLPEFKELVELGKL